MSKLATHPNSNFNTKKMSKPYSSFNKKKFWSKHARHMELVPHKIGQK